MFYWANTIAVITAGIKSNLIIPLIRKKITAYSSWNYLTTSLAHGIAVICRMFNHVVCNRCCLMLITLTNTNVSDDVMVSQLLHFTCQDWHTEARASKNLHFKKELSKNVIFSDQRGCLLLNKTPKLRGKYLSSKLFITRPQTKHNHGPETSILLSPPAHSDGREGFCQASSLLSASHCPSQDQQRSSMFTPSSTGTLCWVSAGFLVRWSPRSNGGR